MDQPRQRLAPPRALVTPPHAAVEVYPRAAVLTAWVNAIAAGAVDGLAECPVLDPSDPFSVGTRAIPATPDAPGWLAGRWTLGEAVTAWPHRESAQCALPVPGDLAGLPADVPGALAAGQAVVVPGSDAAWVLWPSVAGETGTIWRAATGPPVARADRDVRHARLTVMARLTEAVAYFEATGPVRSSRDNVARRMAALDTVPMPPESDAAAVALARLSAQLLVIVDAVLNPYPTVSDSRRVVDPSPAPGQTTHDQVAQTLAPLGRVGRSALATAFSATHTPRSVRQ